MYEIGKRINLTLTLVGEFKFNSYFGYRTIENTVYKMKDADGNVLVWKTSSGYLGIDILDKEGNMIGFNGVHRNDSFTCKATVKEFGEYKGEKQIVLNRVKVLSITHAPTKKEIEKNKAEQQRASLSGEDFIWRMPYKQYKEH